MNDFINFTSLSSKRLDFSIQSRSPFRLTPEWTEEKTKKGTQISQSPVFFFSAQLLF